MRVPPRLIAVVLFVVVGMLSLIVAGLLDWIVGVLFLLMEFLGEVLRSVFRRKKERRHPPAKARHPSGVALRTSTPPRGSFRRRGRPRRERRAVEEPTLPEAPSLRLLVPIGFDDVELLDFALDEARIRQAELIVLFLRPVGVMPMGPIPLPGLAEDPEASAVFERLESDARRLGIRLRTLYEATGDRPSTIGLVATECRADLVVVGAARRTLVSRLLRRDPNPSILESLPERTSLMIHAPRVAGASGDLEATGATADERGGDAYRRS